MVLNNYKITKEPEEGIWISYKELDQIMSHYHEVASKYALQSSTVDLYKSMYFNGKRDFCIDLLKHFDKEEENEQS